MPHLPTVYAARAWLASADHVPAHAHMWWETRGIALLPTGRAWDAIKVRQTDELSVLAENATGPVICDPPQWLYFLVPVDTAEGWSLEGTTGLGADAWVSVPDPARIRPPGPYWVQPPNDETLNDPRLLHKQLASALAHAGVTS